MKPLGKKSYDPRAEGEESGASGRGQNSNRDSLLTFGNLPLAEQEEFCLAVGWERVLKILHSTLPATSWFHYDAGCLSLQIAAHLWKYLQSMYSRTSCIDCIVPQAKFDVLASTSRKSLVDE